MTRPVSALSRGSDQGEAMTWRNTPRPLAKVAQSDINLSEVSLCLTKAWGMGNGGWGHECKLPPGQEVLNIGE